MAGPRPRISRQLLLFSTHATGQRPIQAFQGLDMRSLHGIGENPEAGVTIWGDKGVTHPIGARTAHLQGIRQPSLDDKVKAPINSALAESGIVRFSSISGSFDQIRESALRFTASSGGKGHLCLMGRHLDLSGSTQFALCTLLQVIQQLQ
ncbi:hypothetical protein BDW74DRAFT_86943 [Aspergillus multicolor]|uniref:uncharacterized protein n=1 Tax=Aspergillus multicolor TaxID=41759 RepID=UPI003CCE0101